MAILTINGTQVVDPSEMTVDIFDLSSSESGRTQAGRMVKDIVSQKVKINAKWSTLTWQQTSHLLKAVEQDIFINVRYPDPKEGTYVTKTMYVGDRTSPAIRLVNGKEYWGGVSFELIER